MGAAVEAVEGVAGDFQTKFVRQGGDVQDALTAAIYSANWYVRSNAAASLARQGLDYSDLISVVAGGDRYVREMMLYQLDLRREQGEKTAL